MESVPGAPGNPKFERILSDILVKPERSEEKINEAVYPPESATLRNLLSSLLNLASTLASAIIVKLIF